MQRFDFTFTPSRGPDRGECARQGREAARVCDEGFYEAPSGRRVDVAAAVRSAVDRTREIRPDDAVRSPAARVDGAGVARPRVSVVNGTSLASARALAQEGEEPLVLNFASAKKPGGGFLNGARAQEESLARCSALYACLLGREMYGHHRALGDAMYTSWMIHSPGVPVFRDDVTQALLEEPYACAFLTAPAPNARVVLERDPARGGDVERVLRERVTRVLSICAAFGHESLVLGAWGCGVFGNDPAIVADAFARELVDEGAPFAGAFERVVFAILDWSPDRRFVRPFVERFAS